MTIAGRFSSLALPVIAAPMFLVSGPALALAACKAGLIGAFPVSNARDASTLAEWFDQIDSGLAGCQSAGPYAVNISVNQSRYADRDSLIAVCRNARVPIVITSVGNPGELVKAVHGWGGLVFHDVTTIRHAEKAAEAGVDGLILVCAGAGGHAGAASAFSLLPRVRRFFSGTIVLAGGIATGEGIFAAQALGADLVYMGTRFIASQESMASDAYKAMTASVEMHDIIYTASISGLPANFMRPSISAAGLDTDRLPPPLGVHRGDLPDGVRAWRDIWSAGHAVSLIDDIPPVAEIVTRLRAEYDGARRKMVMI